MSVAAGESPFHDLERLKARERRVLELRFGLADGRPRLLEEVGDELGLTRVQVRLVEARALRKLPRWRAERANLLLNARLVLRRWQ